MGIQKGRNRRRETEVDREWGRDRVGTEWKKKRE